MKGQGLPLHVIVVAALAVLVLIVVAGIFMGGFSKIFRGFAKMTPTEVSQAQQICRQLCLDLRSKMELGVISISDIKYQDYCRRTFWIDINRNGKQESNEILHCWDNPINVECSFVITKPDGTTETIDHSKCT